MDDKSTEKKLCFAEESVKALRERREALKTNLEIVSFLNTPFTCYKNKKEYFFKIMRNMRLINIKCFNKYKITGEK